MNYKAIDVGADGLVKVEVDPNWKKLELKEKNKPMPIKALNLLKNRKTYERS